MEVMVAGGGTTVSRNVQSMVCSLASKTAMSSAEFSTETIEISLSSFSEVLIMASLEAAEAVSVAASGLVF